jgi:hypothetical protein
VFNTSFCILILAWHSMNLIWWLHCSYDISSCFDVNIP